MSRVSTLCSRTEQAYSISSREKGPTGLEIIVNNHFFRSSWLPTIVSIPVSSFFRLLMLFAQLRLNFYLLRRNGLVRLAINLLKDKGY